MKKSFVLYYLSVLLALCALSPFTVSAQNIVINGVCLDNRNKPIRDVGIYAIDSTILAVTNKDGQFALKHSLPGDTIYASHLSFENITYVIDSLDVNKRIVLKMTPTRLQLPEVEFVENLPHVAYDNKVVTVKDFEINEKGIYLLAQRRRNNAILHLNFACDTLTEFKVSPDYYNIFKDVYGEMHIVSDNDVWQVGHKTLKDRVFDMELLYNYPLAEFISVFGNIACVTDSVLVVGKYFYFNQEIYYYYYEIDGDQQPHEFHHCVNVEGRDFIYFSLKNKWGLPERSGSMFLKPTYDPIFAYDNKLYLFAFDEDKTFVYNNLGEVIHEYPLTLHKYMHWSGKMKLIKKWGRKVIMDDATGKFYTIFVDNGVTTIKRINIETGTTDKTFVIGGFAFIENLRIYNGKAYFLYKNDNTRNSRLYEVRIE
ncbi:MAG: hypothetical protein J6034_08395 [Bacteroidaceae bacterium]|nr:hypothetical protein [Bacteroidaceae bacterium]